MLVVRGWPPVNIRSVRNTIVISTDQDVRHVQELYVLVVRDKR